MFNSTPIPGQLASAYQNRRYGLASMWRLLRPYGRRYEPKRGLAGRSIGSPEDDGVIRVIRRHPPIFEPAAYSASFA
jgi:hypothetical protein